MLDQVNQMSDPALTTLRRLVALAHGLPGLTVRIRPAAGPAIEGRRAPIPDATAALTPVPICWLRGVVAVEWAARQEGAGHAAGGEPQLDLGVHPSWALLPLGVMRSWCSGRWIHTVALTAPGPAVRDAALAVAPDPDFERLGHELSIHVADDLGVSLITMPSDVDEEMSALTAQALRAIALRVAVDAVEERFAAMDGDDGIASWVADGHVSRPSR